MNPLPPIYDGHVETLSMLSSVDERSDPVAPFLTGAPHLELDLLRSRAGGCVGAGMAVSDRASRPLAVWDTDPDLALRATLKRLGDAHRICAASEGAVQIVRTPEDFAACVRGEVFGFVLKIEGADCVAADLTALDALHGFGVRLVGPVWNSPNAFGHNAVPSFPGSPDTGPGLTGAGHGLVDWCNEAGVVFDVSHLNEKGFRDVASRSVHPLVATHSNCHALSAHPRNLTDEQLRAVADSGGIVGIVLAANLLRADGRREKATALTEIIAHLEHAVDVMGVDHVGIGSDFDGTTIPACVGDVAGLARIFRALDERGYRFSDLERIAHGNWARVFASTWGKGTGR